MASEPLNRRGLRSPAYGHLMFPGTIPRLFSAGRGLAAAGLLLWSSPSLRAVNPLPPEIERAPLAVQAQYLERIGQESEKLKRETGRRRFEERMQYRQAVITGMVQEARALQQAWGQEVNHAAQTEELLAESTTDEPGWTNLVRNLILSFLAVVLLYRYRHRLFKRLMTGPQPLSRAAREAMLAAGTGGSGGSARLPAELLAFQKSVTLARSATRKARSGGKGLPTAGSRNGARPSQRPIRRLARVTTPVAFVAARTLKSF